MAVGGAPRPTWWQERPPRYLTGSGLDVTLVVLRLLLGSSPFSLVSRLPGTPRYVPGMTWGT